MAAERFTWNEFLKVLAEGASPARARQAAASMRAANAEDFANVVQETHLRAHRVIAALVDEIPFRGELAQAEIMLEQQVLAQREADAREHLEQLNALTERVLQDYLASRDRAPVPLALRLLGIRHRPKP